jgi:agmatine deiminase
MESSAQSEYRWPAEWEPHAATWIAWPHNRETWPGNFEPIPQLFAQLARTLARYEPVRVLAGGRQVMSQAKAAIGHVDNVTLVDIETDDVWIRDYGPTFVVNATGELVAVQWEFNSWGGKYPPWERDSRVPAAVAKHSNVPQLTPHVVLEGGSIDGNGCGTIITTTSCLLDPKRNLDANQERWHQLLHQYLGATDVIWIPGGPMCGDDTDGHVDQLARFVAEDHVVVAVERRRTDDNYEALQANLHALRDYRGNRGERLRVTELPMPQPLLFNGHRLPASYCNFYIANGCVLVPVFDDPADQQALQILSPFFPGRELLAVPARDLVWGLGALHCVTQQQPC